MKTCVIGGCGIDIVGFPKNKLIFKDSNPGFIRHSMGCVARNIAENIFRLGEDVKILSLVGDDHNGRMVLEGLRKLGMDLNGIEVAKDQDTATYLALLSEDGDMEIALSQMEIITEICPTHLERWRSELEEADAIVAETNLSAECLHYLLNNFKGKFFVDSVSVTKSRRLRNALDNIYFLKTNTLEAGEILDMQVEDDEQVIEAGNLFLQKGVKIAAITRGSRGAYIFTENGIYDMWAQKVDVVNTSGAGDAFLSGFVKGELSSCPIEESLKMAMAASLLTIQNEQTISNKLTMENIKEEMKKVCLKKI